ncbi:T9SS type A sorting domain-containing protein [Flavobacterium sp.]|uniref:T9SS type A sorting domain-containing protein n=1 Tax=Flavobacterium sp. TaxID=239 RepID=UPI003263B9A2
MKKTITLILLLFIMNSNAQIGGGWDWAFNTGSLGGEAIKYLKYTNDGSEILFAGTGLAAAYFGSTTLTAPAQPNYPGEIKYFGKINSATGVPTILKSFSNMFINFDCITTDDSGNFYIGGGLSANNFVDLGNGVTVSGANKVVIAKFDASGNAVWAKTFDLGVVGSYQKTIPRLAVSNSGNVFFLGYNPNLDANGKVNYPLYKLDSNGETLWYKDALNPNGIVGVFTNEQSLSDKFIDNNENVHLAIGSTEGFTFDGVNYPRPNIRPSTTVYSTIISLNESGTVLKAQTFDAETKSFQVNRTTGNLAFFWSQTRSNPAPFDQLPYLISGNPTAFIGMVETDANFNFIRAKDLWTTYDNPFNIDNDKDIFLALPNGKLVIAKQFSKNKLFYAGVDYIHPSDPKNASVIIETDADWNITKFISGGKAPLTAQNFLAAYNDTYAMAAGFYTQDINQTPLPTTSYGTVNLTGFNAAPDFGTAYGIFSTFGQRQDVAIVQTKSANFPTIATTAWLGNSTNWNDIANWSNGVPTTVMKALFNQPTPNYPTVSTTPKAASLEVKSGVNLTLPSTLVLTSGLKNDGTVTINDASFFQGLGAKEWRGSGSVNFTGSQVSFFYSSFFSNSLVLNTNMGTYFDLKVPTVTLNNAKINLNNKTLSIIDSSPAALSGVSATNYIYGGTLERRINATGNYEFPVGESARMHSATISANNLVGVDKIAVKYTKAFSGTTPNISYNGVAITKALNGGWFSITPNQQPTSGNYDAVLNIQNSTNTSTSAGNYVVIKRDNGTSAWMVSGNHTLASVNNGMVTARSNDLTSFSDFAIGIGNADITLSNSEFQKQQYTVFPNPASEQINLSFSAVLNNVNVKIISITGQTVYQKTNLSGDNLSLNVSGLANGIYIIQVSDGISVSSSKLIKQ